MNLLTNKILRATREKRHIKDILKKITITSNFSSEKNVSQKTVKKYVEFYTKEKCLSKMKAK